MTQSVPHDRTRPGSGLFRFSAALFLGAIVLMIVLTPFLDSIPHGPFVDTMIMTVVLTTGAMAISGRRRIMATSVSLLVPTLLCRWANHVQSGLVPPEVFLCAGLVFTGFVVVNLMRSIVAASRIDQEVLCAAAANYLVLGLFWSFAYELVARLQPGSFAFTAAADSGRMLSGFSGLYFSFITLGTVGYGDIAPVSNVARMLAMLEATVGVFYMTVLVARLVSLYAADHARLAGGQDGPRNP